MKFDIFFRIFELFLFILPIIPPTLYGRLSIAIFYFISHIIGIQYKYNKFKKKIISNLKK